MSKENNYFHLIRNNVMARKYDGALKNKERTKLKLLDAVGQIIRNDGYSGLKLVKIESIAGVNRKLIYDYFGTVNNLIETYVRTKDYWVMFSAEAERLVREKSEDFGKKDSQNQLLDYFDYFNANVDMQQFVLWQISENSPVISEVCEEREKIGSLLFKLADYNFKDTDVDLRATVALLIGGIYFLVLHAKKGNSLFCEIDVSSQEGMIRIKNAISRLIDDTYSHAEEQKKPNC